nr:Amine (Serotonin 5-HT) G protein-coupled receptor [Hymenolepis microstoma]
METNQLPDDRNITIRFLCRSGDLPTIFIGSTYLCVAITAVVLNILVLTGIAHISYTSNSKRFLEVRRSHNRGHPRFMVKNLRYSKSVRATRFRTGEEDDFNSYASDGASLNKEFHESPLPRSPSCPERISSPKNPQTSHANNSVTYWLNKTNLGRKRTFKHSPQPKPRHSTALYLVCSLGLADLSNAVVTLFSITLAFWRPKHSFLTETTGVYQIEGVEPCSRLFLAALLCTSYNASLCSIASLMLDLYLGVVRPMHYRAVSKSALLRFIFGFWGLSLILGCLHIVLPTIKLRDFPSPIYQRFLLPTEPCSISRINDRNNFCLHRGIFNVFRSGYATAGLLFILALLMITLCVLSLRKVRRDSLKRTRTMRIMASTRSVSLPTINRVNGVPINMRTVNFNVPKNLPRCTGKNLLRSAFTLLSLCALFIAFFAPSLIMDAFFTLTGKAPKLPPWIFDLVTHMPACVAMFNPIIYSLRLSDIHTGLRNFKKRLLSRRDKGFVRKHLRFHREQILVSTKLTAQLRI